MLRENKGILQPKNDVVFQALFGRGKERITKAMLEDILKIKIHKLDLDKGKDLVNDNKENKNGRVDLRAIINDNIECDIEIQLSTHEKMIERFLYYWAKMYTANLQIGEKYKGLRKTISIIIVDDEIKQFRGIHKAHTKWQLREEKYKGVVLTSFCEISIIELPRAIKEYQENKQDEMLQWMMFLDNPGNKEVVEIMKENEDIRDAKEELDKISQDDLLRRMALKADLAQRDYEQCMYEAQRDGRELGLKLGIEEGKKQGIEEGKRQGIEEGKKQGIEEGKRQGIEEGKRQGIEDGKEEGIREGRREGEKKAKLEDAKKMLEEELTLEQVMRITGLTKEEIMEDMKN